MPRPSKGEREALTVRVPVAELAIVDAVCVERELSRADAVVWLVGQYKAQAIVLDDVKRHAAAAIGTLDEIMAPKEHLTMADVRGPYVPRLKPDKAPKR